MTDSGSGLLVLGLLAALWYGAHEHSRAKDVQGELDKAHSQIDDLKTKASALEDASDNLQQQMGRFESENWRDIVSDAKNAADDVDTAKDDLKETADEADMSSP